MKSPNIPDTQEKILQLLKENPLGRNADVFSFCTLIDCIEGAYTIALDGAWGSGKTFFIKQVQMLLNYFNETLRIDDDNSRQLKDFFLTRQSDAETLSNLNPCATVYFDAWQYDNDVDPLQSLMYEILKSYSCASSEKSSTLFKTALKVADVVSGRNVSNIFENSTSEDFFSKLREEESVHDMMDNFVREAIEERGNRLVIFIDELDRCNPDYAIRLLERVKHFLRDERVTVVFTVNINQLQHTVKHHYGESFDGGKYLSKFFDQVVNIPTISSKRYLQTIDYRYADPRHVYHTVAVACIEYFDFTMREISIYYQQLRIAMQAEQADRLMESRPDFKIVGLALMTIVPVALALRIHDMEEYNNFMSGKSAGPLEHLLSNGDAFSYLSYTLLPKENVLTADAHELIEKYYHAIFTAKASRDYDPILLGEHCITSSVLTKIKDVMGQLSGYAKYDFN